MSAVAASAGKKDSMASSASVTSTGVPKIVVVENSERVPASVLNRSGTTTPAYSWLTLTRAAFAPPGAG